MKAMKKYWLTLTTVVGFTNNENILEERDKSEGIYNQGKSSNHILWIFNSPRKCIVEYIQWRSAQVSINYSKTLECKPQ